MRIFSLKLLVAAGTFKLGCRHFANFKNCVCFQKVALDQLSVFTARYVTSRKNLVWSLEHTASSDLHTAPYKFYTPNTMCVQVWIHTRLKHFMSEVVFFDTVLHSWMRNLKNFTCYALLASFAIATKFRFQQDNFLLPPVCSSHVYKCFLYKGKFLIRIRKCK